MLGFQEWLIIIGVLAFIIVPWLNKQGNKPKRVSPKRESQVESKKKEPRAHDVPYTREEN